VLVESLVRPGFVEVGEELLEDSGENRRVRGASEEGSPSWGEGKRLQIVRAAG
jgi:hypothetical protein